MWICIDCQIVLSTEQFATAVYVRRPTVTVQLYVQTLTWQTEGPSVGESRLMHQGLHAA